MPVVFDTQRDALLYLQIHSGIEVFYIMLLCAKGDILLESGSASNESPSLAGALFQWVGFNDNHIVATAAVYTYAV